MSVGKALEAVRKSIEPATRAMSSIAIAAFKSQYEKDLNPLYAWRAYQYCRSQNLPIPVWVLRYLDSSANQLLSIKKPKKNQVGSMVAAAINMNGKIFSSYEKNIENINIMVRVVELIDENKNSDGYVKMDAIYSKVISEFKENGIEISKAKIIRAMKLYK